MLIAIELVGDTDTPQLCVAPCGDAPGTEFDLADLRGVWVIAPDHEDHPAVVLSPTA